MANSLTHLGYSDRGLATGAVLFGSAVFFGSALGYIESRPGMGVPGFIAVSAGVVE